ncbi:MAG: C_GCAxxG_C_C family protein [Ruminococcus sp.]|uniref:C-GCAxxG-C-C family protein n=2 Tax=Ruminococcus TaxID=1263 RepID=UPI002930C5B9|nr:C-GCAxxG-C-C family protein [uncultured Ruminococcus sp.]MBQ1354117.1 C_GCAxxG_C_C family protein [Ruminococcus sp.]MBQ1829514.1 C_GCAxxG_C_C family protein [Ruminococcus sp.]MBQ2280529.1 C_GCAxxG_C_C family protein [Ruminococcus sp.]MBQ4172398.1 C_GCAxxG_C_C family protein [Ruminococcus sp.]MBQ4213892.1 C_GCAxxG_C_C family protein [Ruminococcus sp.]
MNMTKGEIAKNNFQNGCNCAQAVLLAFCEDYGMERETALTIAAGFGSGMAGLRETCGTVTGANMVIGLAKGKNRMEANRTFREFADRFREKNGSLVCKELLAARIKTRLTCADLCYDAGNLLEEILAK